MWGSAAHHHNRAEERTHEGTRSNQQHERPDVWRRSSTGGSITKRLTLKDQSRDQSCLPECRRARSPITSTARPIPAAAEQQQHYDDYQKQFHERSPLMVMSGDSVCAGALFTSSNAPFNEPTTKLFDVSPDHFQRAQGQRVPKSSNNLQSS
jgi:hypothetical protein